MVCRCSCFEANVRNDAALSQQPEISSYKCAIKLLNTCILQTYLAVCQYLTQYGANSLAQVGTLSLVELPYPSGALLCQPDVLQVRLEGFVTFHLGINRHSLVNAPDYLLLGCHNY